MTVKKIVIESCLTCPHRGHLGGFAGISFVPCCKKFKSKGLPHGISNSVTLGVHASPTYEIPDWCPLEDNDVDGG